MSVPSDFHLPAIPELRTANVLGQQICYYDIGHGPALVLVHGIGGDADFWSFCFEFLSRAHRVIALDLLGCGRSSKPPISYRIAGYVNLLHHFLRTIGIDRASMVGNSLGGWVIAAFALKYPEVVDRLVLNDAVGIEAGAIPPPLDLNLSTREHQREILQAMFHDKRLVSDALVNLAHSRHQERGDAYTIARLVEVCADPSEKLDGRLGELKAPTLILWGEQDIFAPLSVAQAFHRLISCSKLEIIAECGHMPPLEKPEEFSARVLRFLEK